MESREIDEGALGAKERPGRRERRKRDTRSRLVTAARELFVARGYDETSIDEIARRAGVSRRTCFRYFPSKEALAFPYRERRLARFDTLIRRGVPGESAYEAVKRACLVMAGEFMAEREEALALERVVRHHPTLRGRDRELDRDWERVIAEALARDGEAGRLPRLLGGAVVGLIRAALELWLDSDGRLNLVELAEEVFATLDHGAPALLAHRRRT